MNPRGFLLFDIDGVIRDVAQSYRLAIQTTVNYFCGFSPSIGEIDVLKTEGIWNNDWNASMELIKRYATKKEKLELIPKMDNLIDVFNGYYFGGDPEGDPKTWTGFIKNEPLLINKDFFQQLTNQGFVWGFVSGAESPSAKFVLEKRLHLKNPPLIAMGDAPDKPDPTGFLRLANQLAGTSLGEAIAPIAYLGDTVADVLTIKNAQLKIPTQQFISFAVSPPHLQKPSKELTRKTYEKNLKDAGADQILRSTQDLINNLNYWKN